MIGVPLMLMCLSNLGRVLAESVRQTYARLCIRQSDHYKCTSAGDDNSGVCGGSMNVGSRSRDRPDTYQLTDEKNEVTQNSIITPSALFFFWWWDILNKIFDRHFNRLKTVIYASIMIYRRNLQCTEPTIAMVCMVTHFKSKFIHTSIHIYISNKWWNWWHFLVFSFVLSDPMTFQSTQQQQQNSPGAYHLITNSPTKSILTNSQHSTPQRNINTGLEHPMNQQQMKLPPASPNKGYVMLPLRKINDSPNHQLIQIQHSNLDNYCRKWLEKSKWQNKTRKNIFHKLKTKTRKTNALPTS